MFPILTKRLLAPNIYLMEVLAPRVACSALPGQFVIFRTDDKGERIPLTVCGYRPDAGTVTIIVQAVGASTRKLCALAEGDSLTDFVGPLGQPSELVHLPPDELRRKRILFIAGGVGVAPAFPQIRWLAEQGAKADVIVGAKSKELLILHDELREAAANLYLATDDGSAGFHGLVTDLFRHLADRQGKRYDLVVATGPMVMMKFVALATKPYAIPTVVSLNSLMVDGTGMCGACRVTVGGKTRFTCVDGPEFDGHLVDFDEALRRQTLYRDQERTADCACLEKMG
ncbi:MAG: sulfide/dihydroorotate dehydrogenase-like FAD/NAD-binding protein [Prevotellaceae bacterium]|jgi:ferredoxin--NADP+ reductase|nr:sulfide/dihydroorotate dehydrogenase-like FAD/NAD-binding protein [Prevotellaceae bacterium]